MPSNEELVRKAAIVVGDIISQGKLNPAQSNRFIDFVIQETALSDIARVIRFRNEELFIEKIGVGARVAVPKEEARDPGVRRGITTSRVTLTPSEIAVPWEIGDNFRELNIEGDDIQEHIIKLMATQLANDLEDMEINGNTLGPGVPEADLIDGGSATDFVKDSFLGLQDGWSLLANSGNVVDNLGGNIGLSLFSEMIQAMPTKFRRNRSNLRFLMSPDATQTWMEKLSTRATNLGDSAALNGNNLRAYGIPMIEVPLWQPNPMIVEHVVLPGTTAVALRNSNITSVSVLPDDLASDDPTTPFILDTDYALDATAGTITRDAGGAIGDGDTVKVTYNAQSQIILTHVNNMIIGIGRDIRIERDRNIFAGVNQYNITAKVALEFEEVTAVVKARNVALSV